MVEAPPGGPVDMAPPFLTGTRPDSGAVGLGPLRSLTFTFSEKMDRTPATGWLRVFPEAKIRKTSWHGATRAEVEFEQPLPADTVLVVEVGGGMRDAHKVAARGSRRFPLATGSAIPAGRLEGSLVMADTGLAGAVVELFSVPPDSLEYFEQPVLRRAVSDARGRFVLDWLPVPGGPWLARAFQDQDGNLRLGEKEARRLLPDTLAVSPADPVAQVRPAVLYPLDAPGRLVTGPLPRPVAAVRCFGIFTHLAAEDSGWTARPVPHAAKTFFPVSAAGGDTLAGLAPGPGRLVLFLDCDRDSSLSVVARDRVPSPADPAWYTVADPAADTLGFTLEPWLLVEPLTIEPGLPQACVFPDTAWTLTPLPPAAAAPDSVAAPDSAADPADSLDTGGKDR